MNMAICFQKLFFDIFIQPIIHKEYTDIRADVGVVGIQNIAFITKDGLQTSLGTM